MRGNMGVHPELSKRNQYRLPADRYYELKHFCHQYARWKEEYRESTAPASPKLDGEVHGSGKGDSTESAGMKKAVLKSKIELVEKTAVEAAGPVLAPFLLAGVTKKNIGYKYLRTVMHIPCGKDYYYKTYHYFFWLLDRKRE